MRFSLRNISIKDALNHMDTGICYYYDDGKIMLINRSMENISKSYLGSKIKDGLLLEKALAEGDEYPLIRAVCGRVWQIKKRSLSKDGIALNELTAVDISAESEKYYQLRESIEKQRDMSQRLKEYGRDVDETAREEEILAAKMNVHDQLGQILLRARHYLTTGEEENMEELLFLWRQNLSLLKNEGVGLAGESSGRPKDHDPVDNLVRTAADIGIEVVISGEVPAEPAPMDLFVKAMHTALTNTIKHAGGSKLFVDVTYDNLFYACVFTNDGRQPSTDFIEGGGLTHLRQLIESKGGSMKTEILEGTSEKSGFTLSVKIPKIVM